MLTTRLDGLGLQSQSIICLALRALAESYAHAVAEATGEPVNRVTFVFLTATGFVERSLSGLNTTEAERAK